MAAQYDPDAVALRALGGRDRLAQQDSDLSPAAYVREVYGENPAQYDDATDLRAELLDVDDADVARSRAELTAARNADTPAPDPDEYDYEDVDLSAAPADAASIDEMDRRRDAFAWRAMGGRDRLRCQNRGVRPVAYLRQEHDVDPTDVDHGDVGALAGAITDAKTGGD